MNKKAIAILGAIFVLIVGTLGFLIYLKYSNKTPASTTTANTSGGSTATGGGSPNSPTGDNLASTTPVQSAPALVKLSDDQVVSPVLFYNGQGITYFNNQGNLFQAALQDNNGTLQLANKNQINIPTKPNITNVIWPAKGSDFIVRFINSAGQPAFSYFNSTTQTYTDLPPQVSTLDWMPDGKQILYVWLQNGKSTLNIGNPDSTSWKYLADMWENDDEIHISPDGSQFLYFETNAAGADNAINSATVDGKIWKSLVKNGQNLGVLWSPDGQKFLFGKKDLNTQGYQLWIYNLTSGEVKNLGVLTVPQKAVWAQDSVSIYAAVPTVGTVGSGSLTTDGFVKIDTNTLEKTTYNLGSSAAVDGRDLFLNSSGNKLLFKNAQDGALYYLDLTKGQ